MVIKEIRYLYLQKQLCPGQVKSLYKIKIRKIIVTDI